MNKITGEEDKVGEIKIKATMCSLSCAVKGGAGMASIMKGDIAARVPHGGEAAPNNIHSSPTVGLGEQP